MRFTYNIEGGDFTRAGHAASSIKKSLKQLNVNPQIIKRVVIAVYEAEVNVVAHAYKGVITADIETEQIIINIEDDGPGIPDIDLAMKEGFSTASSKVREMGFGAGMGLPNMKRNVDKLSVVNITDKGTKVMLLVRFM